MFDALKSKLLLSFSRFHYQTIMTKTVQLSNGLPIGHGDPLSGIPNASSPIAVNLRILTWFSALFILLVVMGLAQQGWSQVVIGGWNTSALPGGLNDFGPSPYAATETAANVTVGGFTRGSGIATTGTAAASGWGGTSWGTSFNNGDSSVLFNDFFTFTVKANAGYTLSLSSIGPFDYRRSATGPLFAEIQYQINAGAYSLITTVSLPSTSTSGASVGSTDLSGIPALQNLPSGSTVTFRIVPFRATSTGGTFYIFDTGASTANDFAVNGTICALPSCSISGPDFVCNNTSGITYTAPADMNSYNWSIGGGGSIPGSTTDQSVSVTSGNYLNDYTVYLTITDDNGCANSCSKQSFIYLFKPPADITINPNPACFGATLDLSIAAASSSTVSWSGEGITDPDGTFIPDGFGGFYNQTTAIPTTTGPHTYSVTVAADNGCSNTGTATVTVNPRPAAPSCPTNSSVCLNTPAYPLTGGSPGGGAYSGPGVSGGNFNPAAAGAGTHTLKYTVTDGNGCSNSCTFTITVNSPPACSITFTNPPPWGQDSACANSTGNIYSAPAGMDAYSWNLVGSGMITSATNGSSVTVTAGTSDYYLYVTITDDNGCVSSCLDETPVKDAPTCTVNGPSSVCSNSTGNVHTVTTDGLTYTWGISGDGMITSATNGSSVTVTAGASGAYTVSVTTVGSNFCPSTCSQTVTIEACCEFIAGCPTNNNLGTYNCNTLGNIPAMPATLANLQAPPYNINIGANPCGPVKFTASDNATPNVCSPSNQTITRTIFIWEDADDDGEYVTDEPSTTCTYTFVVQADLTGPSISCPNNITVECEAVIPACPANFAAFDALPGASASDNCDDNLAYACTTGPLTGGACGGTIIREHKVTDDCGNTNTCNQTITVDDNTNPRFTACPGSTFNLGCNPALPNADKAKTDSGPATDNCGTPTKSAVGGAITGTCVKTQIWTVTATDGCGNTATCTVTYTWKSDTQKPEIADIADSTLTGCNKTWPTLTTTWTDNCAGSGNISGTAGTVQSSGCLQWRTYTFTKTDGCGNTDVETTKVTRTYDVTKPLFVSGVPANITVQCNNVPAPGNPVATDNCDPSVDISFMETRTNGACPDSYVLIRKWTATDDCGNTKTATHKITVVDNTKPYFTWVPQNTTVECSGCCGPDIAVETPTAADNCDVSVTVTYLGEVCTYFNCPANRQLKRTWKATDNCGNWTTAVQLIDIRDTKAPVFTSVPAHATIECSDLAPQTGQATATDACSEYVQVTFLGTSSNAGDCPQEYVLLRTWRATDECGNSVTATQTITVQDTQAPVFNNAPADVTVMCGMVPDVPIVTATDNCDTYVPVTYLGEVNNGPNCPYTITRRWTVTDDCGNPLTHTQNIYVGAAPIDGPDEPELRAGNLTGRQSKLAFAVSLAPNPALEEVWVSFESESEAEGTLRLFDLSGRLATQQSFTALMGTNRYRLDLSGIASGGMYTLHLLVGDRQAVERLVVMKN